MVIVAPELQLRTSDLLEFSNTDAKAEGTYAWTPTL